MSSFRRGRQKAKQGLSWREIWHSRYLLDNDLRLLGWRARAYMALPCMWPQYLRIEALPRSVPPSSVRLSEPL